MRHVKAARGVDRGGGGDEAGWGRGGAWVENASFAWVVGGGGGAGVGGRCRRTRPRGTVMATDTSKQREQLQREGDNLLPTCRVHEGADGQRQRFGRGGGQVAWQRGANGLADRSDARPSSAEVNLSACRRETAWGTKGGMRRTCASATGGVCESARKTRVATTTASGAYRYVLDRPPAQRTSGYTVAFLVPLADAVAATCHPPLPPTAGGELSSGGEKRWSQVAARRRNTRRVPQQVQESGARWARTEAGVREVRAGVTGQRGAAGVLKWHEMQSRGGGVAALGAGVTLLARAQVVVRACRAP